jgi:hypothetical protein
LWNNVFLNVEEMTKKSTQYNRERVLFYKKDNNDNNKKKGLFDREIIKTTKIAVKFV